MEASWLGWLGGGECGLDISSRRLQTGETGQFSKLVSSMCFLFFFPVFSEPALSVLRFVVVVVSLRPISLVLSSLAEVSPPSGLALGMSYGIGFSQHGSSASAGLGSRLLFRPIVIWVSRVSLVWTDGIVFRFSFGLLFFCFCYRLYLLKKLKKI